MISVRIFMLDLVITQSSYAQQGEHKRNGK